MRPALGVRICNSEKKGGTAVIEAPEETFAQGSSSAPGKPRQRRPVAGPSLRRDLTEDFAGAAAEEDGGYRRPKSAGLKLTLAGGLPTGKWGRLALGAGVLVLLGGVVVAGEMAKRALLRDPQFTLARSSAIAMDGAHHVTQAQMLSVFGGDVDRSIFRVPLAERQAQLEQMPWVKRATVMRLLPDHVRVLITERTPVAFVREGGRISLVDDEGVLLDMGSNPEGDDTYSFPVVTGIRAEDVASVRRARMKIVGEFTGDLDSAGEKVSSKLSEVDVSNPEDVKALIPENGADLLVHFGDADYLKRYRSFEEHLPEWRAQYPKLWSVDMRYERQVVLEMQPGSTVPLAQAANVAPIPQPPAKGKLAARGKVASATGNGHGPAAKAVTAKPPAAKTAVTGGKKGPELVGQWGKDGTYHAPQKVVKP